MKSKRGLSAIVATLLIILLTLIAVGIIWVVIRNVVQSGAEQVDLGTKCIAIELSAITVVENTTGNPGVYYVTLNRGSDSQDDIGVKVNVFQGATTSSGVIDFGAFGDLDPLGTVTRTINTTANGTQILNGDKIEFTPFFLSISGEEQLCSQTGSYTGNF